MRRDRWKNGQNRTEEQKRLAKHVYRSFVSVLDLIVVKNSQETRFLHMRIGRTDGPTDGPMDGQTDATKKKDNIAWEFMSGIKQQQHIYFAVLVHDNACKFAAFVKNRHDLSPIMTHLASLDYRVDRHHFKVGSIFL